MFRLGLSPAANFSAAFKLHCGASYVPPRCDCRPSSASIQVQAQRLGQVRAPVKRKDKPCSGWTTFK
eukprot:2997991-Prorocentrum_lima.AAC.1